MIEKYYKVIINPHDKKSVENSGSGFVVKDKGYFIVLYGSNIGNRPEIYNEVKNLATKLIESGEVNPNKKFKIKIKQ